MTKNFMSMLGRLHARLGDFWWYSLMLFCACRAADLLNAFVGLWLVPKYVDPSELGAVLPLTNFANFLALPAAAFANAFRNELTRLSINHEFGKLKTLMRGVFVATAIFLFLAIVAARFTLPLFLERIRIVEGSFGSLIIIASFLTTIAPVYSNALQALKKFKEYSLMNIIGAPVRFLAMFATMPFRALSGYFVGQAAMPMFTIASSFLCLRKELSVPAKSYWNKAVVKKFLWLFTIFAMSGIANGTIGLVETTVIRQRLPELESAGYYMATRFSDIASFLFGPLVFTIFPFTANLAASGKDMRPLIFKATGAVLVFCALIAGFFTLFGKPLLSILPNGEQYCAYWWVIPWQIGFHVTGALIGFYTTAEISTNRFSFMKWMTPLDIIYSTLLLLVTGHGYFVGILPVSCTEFLYVHNIFSLESMLWWMTAFNVIKVLGCFIAMAVQRPPLIHKA